MFVYFIKSGKGKNSPIKIGIAKNPSQRILDLQVGNPLLLELVCKIPMSSRKHAEYIEHSLHQYFSKLHIRGEWFRSKNMNIMGAVDHVSKNSKVDFTLRRSIHGSKKESKIEQLKRSNQKLEIANRLLNQSMDESLDDISISELPERF